MVRGVGITVPLVAAEARAGHQRDLGDALDGEAPHRQRLRGDRHLSLHPAGAHPGRSQPVPVPAPAGRALVPWCAAGQE